MPEIELPRPNERDWGASVLYHHAKMLAIKKLIRRGIVEYSYVMGLPCAEFSLPDPQKLCLTELISIDSPKATVRID